MQQHFANFFKCLVTEVVDVNIHSYCMTFFYFPSVDIVVVVRYSLFRKLLIFVISFYFTRCQIKGLKIKKNHYVQV